MIGRVFRKGPRVVAYRAWQAGRLRVLQRTRFWQRLERKADRWSQPQVCARWLQAARADHFFIGPRNLEAAQRWTTAQDDWRAALDEHVEQIMAGRLTIFDQHYQFALDALPWHTDWRYAHRWPPAQSYSFYEQDKAVPYDVKFPWELSRLGFLLTLVQGALLGKRPDALKQAVTIAEDWRRANPVAQTVNWTPMECSMRAINLVLITLLLASDAHTSADALQPFLPLLVLHGEYLWRKIEYTDVRGNHYAANLVALLLLGAVLKPVYRPARRWLRHATARIEPEILLQYCADGVNFEKSVAYHRLVTELYLLALIVLEHSGYAIAEDVRERIHRACRYTSAYIRPDGWAPNWGDNDSAFVFDWEPRSTRDHGALLAIAAIFFDDAALKATPSAGVPWLFGQAGLTRWAALRDDASKHVGTHWFEAGGMLIAQADDNYLFADYGEVGMRGRGGHGHNDTFSFELCLAGHALVVDAGSPSYTGDLSLAQTYRSTAAHNTLRVDHTEMARLIGAWRISDDARPHAVRPALGAQQAVIVGEHVGYAHLADPVIHRRALTFDGCNAELQCVDQLRCGAPHQVERFLLFAPGLKVELGAGQLYLKPADDVTVICRWNAGAHARIESASVSAFYGEEGVSQRLVLTDEICGESQLWLNIALQRPA